MILIIASLLLTLVKLPWSGIGFWMFELDEFGANETHLAIETDSDEWTYARSALLSFNGKVSLELPMTMIWGLQVTPPKT